MNAIHTSENVKALAMDLIDGSVPVRQAAAGALRRVARPNEAAPQLTAALADSDWLVRTWAADALGRVVADYAPAINALRQATHDRVPYVRLSAELALNRAGLAWA